jgi:hypothetical protein
MSQLKRSGDAERSYQYEESVVEVVVFFHRIAKYSKSETTQQWQSCSFKDLSA